MADKRKLPEPVPEQGLEYAGAAVFPGYHSRPFETTERVRAFSAGSGTLKTSVSNTLRSSGGSGVTYFRRNRYGTPQVLPTVSPLKLRQSRGNR
jgi:hypothetical protein